MKTPPQNQNPSSATQSGQKVARQKKSRGRSWLEKVNRPTTKRNGVIYESSAYHVRIQYGGRRKTFNLETPDKREAAQRAEDIYCLLRTDGWGRAQTEYSKTMVISKDDLTVGGYLSAVEKTRVLDPETFDTYRRKLRRIAADVASVSSSRAANKYDHCGKSRNAWRAAVDSIPLRLLTDDALISWRGSYLTRRDTNPIEADKAKHTVDSIIRNCKSLFGEKVRSELPSLKLPTPIPFQNIRPITKGLSSYRFRSTAQPVELLADARSELRDKHPEQYKIFLLSLGAGLRRMEIDRLPWNAILAATSQIRIVQTIHFRAKSKYSEADVSVEKELVDELLALQQPGEDFVVNGKTIPAARKNYRFYRTTDHAKQLCTWLRSKGISDDKPIHTLRKLFGRMLTEGYGIYAASIALRHSSVAVTAAFYAQDTRRLVPSLMGRKTNLAEVMPSTCLNPNGFAQATPLAG